MTTNTTAPAPAATPAASWFPAKRDSYGRSTRHLYATHRGSWGTVAVVVTMPKSWVESHGSDRYMVSDWRREVAHTRPEPVFFTTLAKAKAYAESLIAA